VNWEPRIELGWLSEEQTADLEFKLTGKHLNLYNLFRGQPYLTHAATRDKAFRESVERWTNDPTEENQRPIMGALPYRRHLKAIKMTILGPPWQEAPGSRRLIKSFVEVCKKDAPNSSQKMDVSDEQFLKTAKLLNEKGEPALEIYRLIAEDLSELITEG
jgi:hypothetical protein